jgi:hypothetical protein
MTPDPAAGTHDIEVPVSIAEGAVLVRPDRFVAWRAARAVEDPVAEITNALHRLVSRGEE